MVSTSLTIRVGVIGAGQMGRALGAGFVASGALKADRLVFSDPSEAALGLLRQDLPNVRCVASNRELLHEADAVVLAVKPHLVEPVAAELCDEVAGKLMVSVAAGVTLAKLERLLATKRVVRVMPNTPCLIGKGASAFTTGENVSSEDRRHVETLLKSVGDAVEVEERLMDAITGLSGSGPAFIYTVIEAMADAGVRLGLPRQTALQLAAQTVYGAAAMVQETATHPAVLRDRVASPGGTTIAGIAALEQAGLRHAVISAVEAAGRRSAEMSN